MIQLGETKTVTIKEPITASVSEVEFINCMDYYKDKLALATILVDGQIKQLRLWEDASYDTAGDWTQDDIEARIIELI